MQQSLETCALELAYESACRQVEFICGSESARQLRLETLILEGKNEELHTQLAQDDKRIDDLEQYALDLQEDVRAGVDRLDVVQGHLRISNREVESLKVIENALLQSNWVITLAVGRAEFIVWRHCGFDKAAHGEANTCAGVVESETRA